MLNWILKFTLNELTVKNKKIDIVCKYRVYTYNVHFFFSLPGANRKDRNEESLAGQAMVWNA